MKGTTPRWLYKKGKNTILDKIFPLKTATVGSFTFHYLRREPPPHDPENFPPSQEFHSRLAELTGNTAIDVGAHIGSYTLELARKFANVLAFEPNPIHNRLLKLNASSNGLRNVVVEDAALSDTTGTGELFIRPGGATGLGTSHYGLKHQKRIFVRLAKLDDYQSRVEKLDFLKIDAEGAERAVLVGASRLLARDSPILGVEVHGARMGKSTGCNCSCCSLISDMGYIVNMIGQASVVGDVHWIWAAKSDEHQNGS